MKSTIKKRKSQKRLKCVLLFAVRITNILVMSEQVIEKIYHTVDTYHVSDIIVACYRERKRNNEKLVLTVLYKRLNTKSQNGEPDDRIHPHQIFSRSFGKSKISCCRKIINPDKIVNFIGKFTCNILWFIHYVKYNLSYSFNNCFDFRYNRCYYATKQF